MAQLFSTLSPLEQRQHVHREFRHDPAGGWWSADGVFAGKSEEDVIAALLDLEEAEIAAIGDCMGGCSMISPKLQDFVRKA